MNLATSFATHIVGLTLYAMCLILEAFMHAPDKDRVAGHLRKLICSVCPRVHKRQQVTRANGADPTTIAPNAVELETLKCTLAPTGRTLLAARGLTEKELLVVCAHIQGLSAAQTGNLLGIRESTVREYRRRCRAKLGARSIKDAVAQLPHGTVAYPDCPQPNPTKAYPNLMASVEPAAPLKTRRLFAIYTAWFAIAMGTVIALFPFESDMASWNGVWAPNFGVGVGCFVYWFVLLTAAYIQPRKCEVRRCRTIALLCIAAGYVIALFNLVATGRTTHWKARLSWTITLDSKTSSFLLRWVESPLSNRCNEASANGSLCFTEMNLIPERKNDYLSPDIGLFVSSEAQLAANNNGQASLAVCYMAVRPGTDCYTIHMPYSQRLVYDKNWKKYTSRYDHPVFDNSFELTLSYLPVRHTVAIEV